MNATEKRIISSRDWDFLDKQYTLLTIASTVTVTIASPAIFTLTAHKFSIGTVIYFTTTGALPTGLSAATPYYVIAAGLTANAFEVSTNLNGSAVNTSGTQSGTHSVYTQVYTLPPYTRRPTSVYITVGSYRYQPKEVFARTEWDRLNQVQVTGDAVTHYFIFDGTIQFFPRPSTATNVITLNARRIAKDLSIADYTTGNIDIVTLGSTAITGASAPAWTTPMRERWLKITPSNVAASSGDGYWYEIDAVTSSTTLILKRAYGGTSLTTGAAGAYTIGEASLLPEPHDMLPIYEALKIYFTSIEPNAIKAKEYKDMFVEGYAQMTKDHGSKQNVVLDDGEQNDDETNPNFYVTL